MPPFAGFVVALGGVLALPVVIPVAAVVVIGATLSTCAL
jgi:hypothetical protein